MNPLTTWAQPRQGPVANEDTYTVQPGDVLEISVWKEPDLQREVIVRPDGAFTFPLADEIKAVGKTVVDIRAELSERLTRFIPDLVVTVMVKEIQGNRIYVIGQVNKPGSYVVNPSVDIVQALSLAGGTTPFASLNEIRILRREAGKQTALTFNYGDVSRGRNLDQNIVLRAGDVVLVP
jgi:polysaccharide export outer membrane protein